MRAFPALFAIACGTLAIACSDPGTSQDELAHRAYIVSLESDELTVLDLDTLEIIGRVPTGAILAHMAELSGDNTKVYVSSPDTDELMVIDARTLKKVGSIHVGGHPTHLTTRRDGEMLAVMNEDTSQVSIIDPRTDTELKRIDGFSTPHFLRYSQDGHTGYVANIGAHHLSVVDLDQLAITGSIPLDGFQGPPSWTPAPDETGFADAQIAPDGILYAAHAKTGKVLVYDTIARAKVTELRVGTAPWIAYAEHPFKGVSLRHLVPNFGDSTVSLIDGKAQSIAGLVPGDPEAYGVNVTPLAPDRAYVMNRVHNDIALVDTSSGELLDRIPVGGNTETAATSADGKYVVAAVSSANRLVILDAATGTVVKTIDGVGKYPWSVTIPFGQNYCH
jgi:YVTN family beta-propeller protein